MKRTLFQVYVRGGSEALTLYERAFNAKARERYFHDDGTLYHSELDVYGQTLAVSELPPALKPETGNAMQFCLHFGEGETAAAELAYETLKEGAEVYHPLGPCDYSPLMADLADRFGVRWCIFAC